MSIDGLVILLNVIAVFVFIWSTVLVVAIQYNRRPNVMHWPDGSRSIHLVDFGPLAFSGVVLCGTLALSAIYAGLTIN